MDTGFSEWSNIPYRTRYAPTYPDYKGEWNPTGSYVVDDMVRVLPGRDYIGSTGANPHSYPWLGIPTLQSVNVNYGAGTLTFRQYAGQININGTNVLLVVGDFNPIPGTYICVSSIPSMFTLPIPTLNGFSSIVGGVIIFPGLMTSNISAPAQPYLPYSRFANVNYYPSWPEMPNLAAYDPNNLWASNGRYWELISLLPSNELSCNNGSNITTITDTQTIPSDSQNYTGSYTKTN